MRKYKLGIVKRERIQREYVGGKLDQSEERNMSFMYYKKNKIDYINFKLLFSWF